MNSKAGERVLALILFWAAAAAITYVFWWMGHMTPDDDSVLVTAPNFSAVFAYWGLFFTFFVGLYLGMGGGECFSCTLEGARTFSPDVLRKAGGTGIAFVGTAVSVMLTTRLATYGVPEGALGLNFTSGSQVLSLLPLHWGFVWLVFVQHLGLV
ncbi:MAG: hypothetical protein ACYC6T_18425 [Thermoleophilia bacterium]